MTTYYPPLPQSKEQQYGRKDELHQVIGYKDDAEGDDDERHQHYRCVNAESTFYLVAC